jgi:hypothetical protein
MLSIEDNVMPLCYCRFEDKEQWFFVPVIRFPYRGIHVLASMLIDLPSGVGVSIGQFTTLLWIILLTLR